ncbi:MAG: hypothetical protein AAGB26_14885 [Planctomycetota bacterium]
MKKWNLLAGLVIFTLCIGIAQAEEQAKTLYNDVCPISGEAVNQDNSSDYQVEFCCKNCKGKFDKDPSKYLEKAAEAEEGTCIFNGRPAKTSSTLTVGFCCGGCKSKFDKEPNKFITKVTPSEKDTE